MKCSIQGCLGNYENKRIVHTVQREGQVFVFEHVPVEMCSVCGDTLMEPETIRHMAEKLASESKLREEEVEDLSELVKKSMYTKMKSL